MMSRSGETWRFHVRCPGAERVYLVREEEGAPSTWIPMEQARTRGVGEWELIHYLIPGRYRFRYYRAEGTTYFNCGTYGLAGQRIGEVDPQVRVDNLELAMSGAAQKPPPLFRKPVTSSR